MAPAQALAVLILSAIGFLHVFWAVRGKGVSGTVVPTVEGKLLFVPGRMATAWVGVGLLAVAAVLLDRMFKLSMLSASISKRICLLFALIFFLRAVGEFNYLGFFKRSRDTKFAYWDTRVFSPLSLLLAILMALSV